MVKIKNTNKSIYLILSKIKMKMTRAYKIKNKFKIRINKYISKLTELTNRIIYFSINIQSLDIYIFIIIFLIYNIN